MNNIIYQGSGERIDTWLTHQFDYSRNFFHHIIERQGIKVNNKTCKKSYKLKNNDNVTIDDLTRYLSPILLEEAPNIEIEIILEKEDYLVLNKPKGVLAHPNSIWDIATPSVVGFLYHRYKSLPSIGNFVRAGLLHRLDKDTDGLMLIAKTEKGLKHFKALFQAKSNSESIEEKENCKLKKFYRAISYHNTDSKARLESIQGQLPFYIEELVIAKVPHNIPKLGISKIIKTEWIDDDKVKIFLEILTGRTHQIRCHLTNKGLPIVGDYLYGKEEEIKTQLTAYKLEFEDTNGEYITVELSSCK